MLLLDLPTPFSLADTLNCGQAFRWSRQPDGSEVGVVKGRLVQASEHDGPYLLALGVAETVRDFLAREVRP